MVTGASCPHCGREAALRTSRCQNCDFVFFEDRAPRQYPRRGPIALTALAFAAALAGGVVLLNRDEPAAAPERPEPVAAAPAGRQLERQFVNAGADDTAAVRCGRAIRLAGATRCQVRYANGDTQLILVGLDRRGELDITIPYPAQRRPGD